MVRRQEASGPQTGGSRLGQGSTSTDKDQATTLPLQGYLWLELRRLLERHVLGQGTSQLFIR